MTSGIERSLFGTDGIREKFGSFPLDPDSIVRIGSAVREVLGERRILMGMDTRDSGTEIGQLLLRGLGGGPEIYNAGVLPTPALSFGITRGNFDLGIMITASHNPWDHNGIKLFGPDGEKLPDELQEKISRIFYSRRDLPEFRPEQDPPEYDALPVYTEFLRSRFSGLRGTGSPVLLDCANGAVYKAAPRVYSLLGIPHVPLNHRPDGKNINRGCGSTEPGHLRSEIRSRGGDLGFAFDGDGDRVLMMDGSGRLLDGDFLLFLLAGYLRERDPGFPAVVVGTVMSNLALERQLEDSGIRFYRSDVGDRNVFLEMKKRGALLGGEQSGHIICRDLQPAGDGILVSLLALEALEKRGLTASEAAALYRPFPQETRSIPIRERRELDGWKALWEMTHAFQRKHGQNSRILIRYSGTEKKVRLMIESEEAEVIQTHMEIFENFLISEIGEES